MKTRLILLIAVVGLAFSFQPALAQDCVFQLGFKALHDLIPDVVGDCLDNERHNPAAGITKQSTTNGQLIWRKADNWTGFTDGQHTWINGPQGLQQRLNTERLPWETSDPATTETQRLTLDQLRNAEYRLPLLGDEDTPIQFTDGKGQIAFGEGATKTVYAGIVNDTVAFGDLDGDGIADAVVVAFISGGGSGTFIFLIAVFDRDGAPAQADWVFLGDRVPVRSLTIAGGEIVAQMVVHRPSDGLCCPTLEITRTFGLEGGQLAPRQALAIEAPLPGATVGATVELRGRISAMPFEKNLTYRIYNQSGIVVDESWISVDGDYGGPGAFVKSIDIPTMTAPGILRIEVREESVVDGALIVSASAEVNFTGGS